MRSYIFTKKERNDILQFLYTPTEAKNAGIRTIKSRVRHFSQLPKDIELYMRLTEAMEMDTEFLKSLTAS